MWTPKYFAKTLESLAKQVLPPEVYKFRGVRGLELMDERILITLDTLRLNLGIPITVNSWAWGGNRTQSGLRDQYHYKNLEDYLKSFSQHKYGNALDFKVRGLTAHEVRKHIIENKHLYPSISFMEVGKLSNGEEMTWCHIDCRNRLSEEQITYWSPKHGYVEEQRVLDQKL